MSQKTIGLVVALMLIGGSIYYLESQKNIAAPDTSHINSDIKPRVDASEDGTVSVGTATGTNSSIDVQKMAEEKKVIIDKSKKYPLAKEISTPDGFINTDSTFAIKNLVGKKVILVDFWTYSCINCQRTTPYLNAWYQKYKDQGLEIVGVHTPEFEFEKNYDNVKKAVEREGIQYPVVLDNDYSTWTAYQNRFWPRKYLIDIDGFIVYDHIGEGAYDETEKVIQALLSERMVVLNQKGKVDSTIAHPENVVQIDPTKPLSPETYFGSLRGDRSAGYLVGQWDVLPEYAETKDGGAKIVFKYQAKNVYFVASASSGAAIKILRDGKPVDIEAGKNVSNGSAFIKDEQLYHLIAEPQWGQHTLEIQIDKAGLRAFTFTFG